MDENPYKDRYTLARLGSATLLGGLVAAVLFGPILGKVPGDPSGPSIAFGAGGLAALAGWLSVELVVRLVRHP